MIAYIHAIRIHENCFPLPAQDTKGEMDSNLPIVEMSPNLSFFVEIILVLLNILDFLCSLGFLIS